MRRLEPVDELKEGLSCDRFCPTLHRDASARVASVGLRWTETQETADIVKMCAGPRDEVYVRVWPAGLHAVEALFLARMIDTDGFAESRTGLAIAGDEEHLDLARAYR